MRDDDLARGVGKESGDHCEAYFLSSLPSANHISDIWFAYIIIGDNNIVRVDGLGNMFYF
jgi:hypothetical protein